MMRTHHSLSLLGATLLAGGLCAVVHPHLFANWLSHVQWRVALTVAMITAMFGATAAKAQTLTLRSAPGGITLAGGTNAYTASFGNMNGLGVGTAGTGVVAIPLSNGALYYTPIRLHSAGLTAGRTGTITAYVSTNFTRTAAVTMEACPSTLGCIASGDYSILPTSAASAITVGGPGSPNNSNVTVGLAIFVPDNNGGTRFAGSNTVTITFTLIRSGTPVSTDTATLTITAVTQTAVQLTLATAPGGGTINTSSDFSLDFGNVNGLGIGPKIGFSIAAIPGGVIYNTPYLLQPAFAEFATTTATINVALTTPFGHTTILDLRDASAAAGPYTSITATQSQITNSAADRSSVTRYLGLFVSNVNGATSYTGADNATLTFTMTVP